MANDADKSDALTMVELARREIEELDESIEHSLDNCSSETERQLRWVRGRMHEVLVKVVAAEGLLNDQAEPTVRTGCDHKFVDSTCCLKCGWEVPRRGGV